MSTPADESTHASPWGGQLALTPGLVIYSGPGGKADLHSHHAIQLIQSFDSSFDLETEDGAVRCESALIPSGMAHKLECDDSPVLITLVEPLGPRGSDLNRIATETRRQSLDGRIPSASSSETSDPLEVARASLSALLPARPSYPTLSPHVTAALTYLDEAVDGKPSLDEAASVARISPSRLTHIFTDEIGIPFRKYVLWLRLRRVVDEISDGANLTEAAFAAGFSDSPHLSKVFRENFGLSPSALLGMTVSPEAWPRLSS